MNGSESIKRSWKKKRGADLGPADPFSAELRELTKLANQGDFAKALSRIDHLLAAETETAKKAQLILLVAGIEERKRDFAGAMSALQSAAKVGNNNPSIKIVAGIGMVRVLLAEGDHEKAVNLADSLVKECSSAIADYDAALSKAQKDVSFSDRSFLPSYPVSRAEVTNSLAAIFEAGGCSDQARAYWEKSQGFGKSVAAEAGLARLAWRSGDKSEAQRLAYSALVTNHFRSASLGAIALVLRSCPKEEQTAMAQKILEGLKQAKEPVRDRGVYEVVRCLRSTQNPSWVEIAQSWLDESGRRNPIIAAELKKILLIAARKEQENPVLARDRAEDLLATAEVAPAEWIMAAKEVVRGNLALGSEPNFETLLVDGCARYGDSYLPRLAHSMAVACVSSGRDDLAEGLLRKAVQLVPFTERQWSQSMWQLASILNSKAETDKQFADCNQVWDAIASNPNVEARFRVCARLKWLEILADQGDLQAATGKYDEIEGLCRSLTELTSLLLVARNLRGADERLTDLGVESLDRAIALSGIKTKDVLGKNDVKALLAIGRIRLDYHRYDDIAADWDRFARSFEKGLLFLSSDFWDYAAVTVAAYGMREQWDEADRIAEWVVAHPAVTPYGKVAVWSTLGMVTMFDSRPAEAFPYFEKADKLQLMAPGSAVAAYWLALRAFRSGKTEKAERYAARCLDVLSNESALTLHQAILVKVLLLKANFAMDALPKRYGRYSQKFKENCLTSLKIDLGRAG